MTKKEYLEALNGQEIPTLEFEGTVLVRDGKIIQYGEVIDKNPTKKTLEKLFNTMFMNDFGGMSFEDIL